MQPVSVNRLVRGFTLLELVVALALFSLLMLWTYESLDSGLHVQARISESITVQEELRATHQTLRQAIGSGGRIVGDERKLMINLQDAGNIYTQSRDTLLFIIQTNGSLVKYQAGVIEPIMQLNHAAEFRYLSASGELVSPDQPGAIAGVEFLWSSLKAVDRQNAELTRWLFIP